MIKKSLTAKLFVFIMLLFLTQVVLQFSFQKFFLADFYENQKIEFAESIFEDVVEQFNATDDMTKKVDLLYDYMAETDEPILVFNRYDDYHEASYSTSFKQVLSVEIEGQYYDIPFDLDQILDQDINFLYGISVDNILDAEVIVVGFTNGDNFIPYGFEFEGYYFDAFLSIDDFDDTDETTTDQYQIEDEYTEKMGVIVDIEERFIDNVMQKKINDLSEYYFQSIYGLDSDFEDYNFMIKTVRTKNDRLTFVSALSLQPINEVMEIQAKFQGYLTAFMVLLIVIVSLIFSKVISKPIVSISKSTAEIAKMNFHVECDETRTDEIGYLGKSINILSHALKEKIDTLESEIEFERRQEKIRREFVADVSHELKTPLGVIKSYSEGIMDGISKDKADYYLQVILEEVDKMNGLVIDMLELSNLEAGRNVLDCDHINLKRMVNNLLRNFEPLMAEMTVDIDLDDTMVDVDINKMELVITNILSNAFRYVDAHKIINIRLKNKVLSIENSYETIDDASLNKIWDRFYRLEKSRSRSFGGNGLGLSIVKKTLELHDLDYSVENSSLGFLFKISF